MKNKSLLISFYLILCSVLFSGAAISQTYTSTVNFDSNQGLSYNYVWTHCLQELPDGVSIDSAKIEVRAKVWYWGWYPSEQNILASNTNSFNFSDGDVCTLTPSTNPSPSSFYTVTCNLSASQLDWITDNKCINFEMVTSGGTYYLDYAKLTVEHSVSTVATPDLSPVPGIYNTSQDVSISSDTQGATITYTTDGTDPDEMSPVYNGSPIKVSVTTTIKAKAFKTGWNPSEIATKTYIIEKGNESTLYLRDNKILSEEQGDGSPWVTRYVYPQGQTTSAQWQTELRGDISGSFKYSMDVVKSDAAARLRLEFIIDQNGTVTTAGTKEIDVGILQEGYYQTYTGFINGLNLSTKDGDILILKITCVDGTKEVGVGIDGTSAYNDSNINVFYQGPVACFSVDPVKGEWQTQFSFDASCSFDNKYTTSELQVRWDWDNDGTYDTVYSIEKATTHRYNSPGIKTVKLQVKNPDGLTLTKVKNVSISLIILDSFTYQGSSPVGLAWDGENLWASDSVNGTIFKSTPTGQVLTTFASPCADPLDIAWDGENLWVLDAWGSDEKGNVLFKIDTSGNLLTSFNVPQDISTGLTWDGLYLWGADGTNNRIVKLDPQTGDEIASFASPGPDPRGLAWDGQYLWNVDWTSREIYQLDTNSNVINTFPAPGTGPMGLSWDGKNLWCADIDSHKVYKLTDRIPTSITCELSSSNITLGELLNIAGQIDPSPGIAGKGVSIELIPPAGDTIYKATLADINGRFSYSLECGDINRAGNWTIRTSWAGDAPYEGSTSNSQVLSVSKAQSQVVLDVTSKAIKIGDPVSISGKFTPEPDCGKGLSGITLTLKITGSQGTEILNVDTSSQYGHFLISDYDGLNLLGDYTIQAELSENDSYLSSCSDPVQVRVMETAGYAVVIQGKISNEEGLASHNKTANYVYNSLKDRGFLDEDIQYLNYNINQPGVNGVPDKTAIFNAITVWAKDKMNNKPSNLYIVMVDHGFNDVFKIDPDEITATELAGWLNTLQTGLTGQAQDQMIVAILGFCRSGSFIDNLSGSHRVIIASAAPDESSYKGPLDEDGIREGEYFISEFFKSVSIGKSVKESFQKATFLTEVFASSGSKSSNAPYYDNSLQHPLFDDNGDGLGSNDLSNQGGDGVLSSDLFIGLSHITGNDPGNVTVNRVADAQFIGADENSVNLWAQVDDNGGFSTLWVEVKPPNFVPVGAGGTGQAYLNLTKTPTTDYNDLLNHWEWSNLEGFSNPGTYQVFYFARDKDTGNVSPLMETLVYKAKEDNNPPSSLNLVLPEDGITLLTSVLLDWEDSIDPDGDSVNYTLLLSKDDPNFSNPIRKEGLLHSTCLLDISDGIEDLSHYYWKVQAIDTYGAIQESEVRSFYTNNTNPVWPGWIKGHVSDTSSNHSVAGAMISVGGVNIFSASGGYYLGQVPAGNYTVTVTASGYNSKSFSGLVIPEGGLVTRNFGMDSINKGNINGDATVDLADAILALKVVCNMDTSSNIVTIDNDVNGDNRIGLEDVVYIMQKIVE